MKAVVKAAALVLTLALVAGGAALVYLTNAGLSARQEPGAIERTVARTARMLVISRTARDLRNPIERTPEVVAAGRAHFADHCAICHGNDGGGKTEIGQSMWPKTPDMRQSTTQDLSDGELFWIVENGIRFTGMPGFRTGTAEGEASSWHLVHFIRHLPDLSEAEIVDMEELNPRPPAEIRQQIEEERFLRGDDVSPVEPRGPAHAH